MVVQHNKWAGLMSNASPYALPPGAATVQVNLTTEVPGQLTSRGGMLPVRFASAQPELLDIYPYESSGKTYLVGLTSQGHLVSLESPASGEDSVPVEPSLTVSAGEVAASYTYRYVDGAYGAVQDVPPGPPPGSGLLNTLNGSADAVYLVDAENLCEENDVSAFDGGTAPTSRVPPSVPPSGLCEL